MKHLLIPTVLLFLASGVGEALPHGAIQRGSPMGRPSLPPGPTMPPPMGTPGSYGGAGGAAPGAPTPATPVSGRPSAGPAPSTPAGPSGPTTDAPEAAALDATAWQIWWRYNRAPYLDLKARLHSMGVTTGSDDWFLGSGERTGADTLRPSAERVREVVVPALERALEDERSNDIVTGAMVALARIGEGQATADRVTRAVAPFLTDSSQEIAETAALAHGILAHERSIESLLHLLRDDPAGRELVGAHEVPLRTRAFAAFGLGLVGHATEREGVRRWIVRQLCETLASPDLASLDVHVAAAIALGLVPLRSTRVPAGAATSSAPEDVQGDAPPTTRAQQVDWLIAFFQDERERDVRVRAHVARSIARLVVDAAPEARARGVAALARPLRNRADPRFEVRQGAVVALGVCATASAQDRGLREALIRTLDGGDELSKRLAWIALGRAAGRGDRNDAVGTAEVRSMMLRELAATGRGRSRQKPWIALAIAVMERARIDAGSVPSADAVAGLRAALADSRSAADIGAYCIALGLVRDLESAPAVRAVLRDFGDDDARGHAAVALGLMGDRHALELCRAVVETTTYRPSLLIETAVALGLLGDKQLASDLVDALRAAKSLSSQAALAMALGHIGDTRSIDPLVAALRDSSWTARARAFAAVALGLVADKEPVPWNTKLAEDLAYGVVTDTLSNGSGTGVLDIL